MIFFKLQDALRISLTKTEAFALFGNDENIDRNSPQTRAALRILLKKALCDRLIKADCSSVKAEIIRNFSGGFDIYFRKSKTQNALTENKIWILEFGSLENAIKASKQLILVNHSPSSLYRINGCYRMTVTSYRDALSVEEFADAVLTGTLCAAVTEEHGKMLISDNAIHTLAKL